MGPSTRGGNSLLPSAKGSLKRRAASSPPNPEEKLSIHNSGAPEASEFLYSSTGLFFAPKVSTLDLGGGARFGLELGGR